MPTRTSRVLVGSLVTLMLLSVGVVAQEKKTMAVPKDRGMVMSKYGFDETVSNVKQAIEGQQMMVLFSADHQQMLKMVGVDANPMTTVEFFHPRYGKRIFEGNMDASAEVPLRIMVMQGPMGTMVEWVKPSTTIGKYKGLGSLGTELDATLQKIASAVAK
ncbi:MAG: DUF302 domain-containing protein [Acidobacteria bacterium]|nr:DUF302 domain-containing protein [Acidobacteriota bacterium]